MVMRNKIKQGRKYYAVCVFGILMGLMLLCRSGMVARAEENSFVIEANMLPSNEETYDMQLSVENMGRDWEGTVRVTVMEEYRSPGAYDTAITLPQGSTKQFVVKVPVNSLEGTDGTIWVTLWDKESHKIAEKEFRGFLRGEEESLSMGILSDDYSSLTYLDMGGAELYYYGYEYPIRLVEVEQGNIVDTLDTLEFLVIDTYNTEVLTDEELKAIELWNYDGGVLLVGTGSYGEDTLKGFEDGYLGITCKKIYAPGELGQQYYSDYLDLSQLSFAELRDESYQYFELYLSCALACSIGDGAVGVLPYSLTELAKLGSGGYQGIEQEDFVMNMLEEVSSHANSRYNISKYNTYYDNVNMLGRMLRMIGNVNSPLQFGTLKLLVIVYVIFVGPILYILLRLLKKRELYWVAVPVTAFVGIILIFFAGRGFEVVDTRVYSVTTENLSEQGDSKSYLYCYDASHDEWDLKLAGGYEYAGALINDNYYYGEDKDVYYHHIKKEGDALYFGIKPSSNFEDSYFYASKGGNETVGTIENFGIQHSIAGITGTITNGTDWDFLYYAVIVDDTLYVYENLPAGATCDLARQMPVYSSRQGYNIWSDYTYDFLNNIYDEVGTKHASAAGALGVGLCAAYPQSDINATVVVGVTENWDKTVDDNCSEISYGCLYTIQ